MPGAYAPKFKSTNQQKYDSQMDPVGYCWSHGYKVKQGHNSATCTRKKPGHQDAATRTNIMGGSTTNKNWIHPQCIIASATTNSNNDTNNESNVYLCQHNLNFVVTAPALQPNKHYAILDSGATDHYLQHNPNPAYPSSKNYKSITVTLPNGATLKSTRDCTLPIRNMNKNAICGHVIPTLNKSLLLIGKLCDANYTAVFTNKDVKICTNPVQIPDDNVVFTGHRNFSNGLYFADLNAKQTHLANKIDHLPNATKKNAITFLYLAAFSPAISTLTTAIQKGFFKLWPGFTVEAIKKYVSNMPHVSAGRMDHV